MPGINRFARISDCKNHSDVLSGKASCKFLPLASTDHINVTSCESFSRRCAAAAGVVEHDVVPHVALNMRSMFLRMFNTRLRGLPIACGRATGGAQSGADGQAVSRWVAAVNSAACPGRMVLHVAALLRPVGVQWRLPRRSWVNSLENFDDLWHSFCSLFVITTGEAWVPPRPARPTHPCLLRSRRPCRRSCRAASTRQLGSK